MFDGRLIEGALSSLDTLVKKSASEKKGEVPKGISEVRKAGETLSTALSSGGALLPEQQDTFLDTVTEESRILRYIRTLPMNTPSRLVERMAFTSRFLKPLTEYTAPAASIAPTFAKLTLDTFEFGGLCTLTYNTLQDSIEGGRNVRGNRIEAHVMRAIARAVARDIDYYLIMSDTASGDPDLTKFDGMLKAAGHTYSHLGAPLSKLAYKKTLQSLPKKFRQDKRDMAFFHGPGTDTEWRDELADRGTGLGDRALSDNGDPEARFGIYGLRPLVIPMFPEDLGAGSDETKILCTNPSNAICGIWREVYFDWDKDVSLRALKVMVTLRMGFIYEDPDGVAVGTSIKVA